MLVNPGTLMSRLRGGTAIDQTPFAVAIYLTSLGVEIIGMSSFGASLANFGMTAVSSATQSTASLSNLGVTTIQKIGVF